MTHKAVLTTATLACAFCCTLSARADDYYVFADWSPGINYTTGLNGFLDTQGRLGAACEEYLFLTGGPSYDGAHTAYVYRVSTAGDPECHPSNPDRTCPIAARSFDLVSTHAMNEYPAGAYYAGHENAFFIDDTGIYYGASRHGVYRWDFNWAPQGWVVSAAPGVMQSFTRTRVGAAQWWVGDANRNLYRWDGANWTHVFTHPELGGGHHDGMEVIGESLYVSDMTSDVILQYRLDRNGNPIDPANTPYKRFNYSNTSHVEGFGFGPNSHIWISGWDSTKIYELGGGELQKSINPEVCNNVDDDCDGLVDEELTRTCATACGQGTEWCDAGNWVDCDAPGVGDEICDGLDNDCDGSIDEGCGGCITGSMRECGNDTGECAAGTQTCDDQGEWSECVGFVGPTAELCDGLDNDCDGDVDEGCDCKSGDTRACGSDVGACIPGIQVCDMMGDWGECIGAVGPTSEVCDCVDNDCSGKADDAEQMCERGSVCIACQCAEACAFGECPAGLVCENEFCVPALCTTDADCKMDQECVDGRCFTACETIQCDPGYECRYGQCFTKDCAVTGCAQGENCIDGRCQANPCAAVQCEAGEFCRDGQCLPSCADVQCGAGQRCEDGTCVADPCALCDPVTEVCNGGACVKIDQDPCKDVECPQGLECLQGRCVPEPCTRVGCPEGQSCEDGQCVYGDLDGDGQRDNVDGDVDGDGINNEQDTGPGGDDRSRDHDNDGTDDPYDSDDDGDGIPDGLDKDASGEDRSRDHDNDGTNDGTDNDDDNDGTPDGQDKGPGGEDRSRDHDNDGTDDALDADDDNDGTPDGQDKGPGGEDRSRDHDNDGTDDGQDPDDDNDGTPDAQDIGPGGEDRSHDCDNDGQDDAVDPDDDNDGTPDEHDIGPNGEDYSRDTDNDGMNNAEDGDDDNDGVPDEIDTEPLIPATGGGGGSSSCATANASGALPALLLIGLLKLAIRRRF